MTQSKIKTQKHCRNIKLHAAHDWHDVVRWDGQSAIRGLGDVRCPGRSSAVNKIVGDPTPDADPFACFD